MMESAGKAAAEDRHSMRALKAPVNKKARWQESLLLLQALQVRDASEHRERCSLCFSPAGLGPEMSLCPTCVFGVFLSPREDTALAEMPCQGVRSPVCCTCC